MPEVADSQSDLELEHSQRRRTQAGTYPLRLEPIFSHGGFAAAGVATASAMIVGAYGSLLVEGYRHLRLRTCGCLYRYSQ